MAATGAAERSVRSSSRPLPLGALLLVALAATLPYLNSFGHEFVRDAEILIRDNPAVSSWGGLLDGVAENWWGTRIEGGLWRPAVLVTWWANHALGGLDTFGFTLLDILIHVAVTLTLVRLARSLGASVLASVLAGLLFAAHPVHVEAVTAFVGRADTMAALFALLALLAHRRAAAVGGRARLAAAACFGVALLSKESAFALVVLLPALDALCPSPGKDGEPVPLQGRLRRDYTVYAVVLALVLVGRFFVLGGLGRELGTIEPRLNPLVPRVITPLGDVRGATLTESLLTPAALVTESARLLVWPARQSADYSFEHFPLAGSPGDPRVLVGWALMAATLLGAWRWRRTAPAATFALVLLAAPWLVTGNVFFSAGTLFGERLLYLPSAGALMLAGLGLAHVARADAARRRAVFLLCAVAVLALGGRTWARNRVWHDTDTITRAMAEDAPNSYLTRAARGIHLALAAEDLEVEGRPEEGRRLREQSVDHLLTSLTICPEHDPTNRMLVSVYWGLGRLEEALPLYARLAKLAPDDAVVFGGWASTLIELAQSSEPDLAASRHAEALRHLDHALSIDPDYTGAWLRRGLLRRDVSGDVAGAAADLRTVLRLEPSHPERDAIAAEAARLEALSGG